MLSVVACPACKRPLEWSAQNPWRPFCSERCKLVDLGAWLTEAHAIPGEPVDERAVDPKT
ncbi:MAG: DNA gyrase inhibitor YacG [Gammaproteobacteria bacterium]|nr:DNA gyrase inhibitor YacG [Gammaproteobacteria bacterium]MDE2252079.1 DNA gyrase inhibitor YacG [Gammaproteobacteria bacterium]